MPPCILTSFWCLLGLSRILYFSLSLFFFFKFHLELLVANTTTIESLEKQRNPQASHDVNMLNKV